MASYTCPICHTTSEAAAEIAGIAICGDCGASLAVTGDTVRAATAADTTHLELLDLQQLRRARATLARPERRSR